MKRSLIRLGGLFAAAYVLAAAVIVLDGFHDRIQPSDVAVVLGSKVDADGRPSPSLAGRLDEALELYRKGLFRQVIVSGGTGPNGYDEARVMKAYLIARGVPDAAVIMDPKGATTRLTALNTAAIMRARGFRSVLAISQYFHIPRCRLALAQASVTQVRNAHARLFIWRDLYSIPREVAGYAAYWIGGSAQAAKR